MDKREAEVARLARPIAARRRAQLRRALWLPWLAVGVLLLLCGVVSAWLNWEATKEEEAPGALRLSWILAVVGSTSPVSRLHLGPNPTPTPNS